MFCDVERLFLWYCAEFREIMLKRGLYFLSRTEPAVYFQLVRGLETAFVKLGAVELRVTVLADMVAQAAAFLKVAAHLSLHRQRTGGSFLVAGYLLDTGKSLTFQPARIIQSPAP